MCSCWHSPSHPNGGQMSFFFLSWRPKAQWLRGCLCCSNNHRQRTRKLAPFNESHNCFEVKLHPFKPVLHVTQRGTEKSVYLQFIAEWKPQRQKWDMCKLLCIHSILTDESSMYERRGWIVSAQHICMIADFEMEKSKQSFLEQNVNFLAVSSWPGMVNNHRFSCCAIKGCALQHFITGDHRKVRRHARWIKAG